MGVFNVIKLANDYVHAKRYLKKNKVDATKIRDFIDRLQDYIEELRNFKAQVEIHINKAKEVIRALSDRLKARKAGK